MGVFENDLRFDDLKREFPDFKQEDAISHCGGSADLCLELLKDFVTDLRIRELILAYKSKDWKDYRVKIHSMKGAVRTFGLPKFGNLCEKLQVAAEEENEASIEVNHQEMVKMYLRLLDIAKRIS